MRRSAIRLAATAMMLTMLAPHAFAAKAFSDVNDSTHGAAEIRSLADQGFIQGYGDLTFRPDAPVTRAELLKVLILASTRGDTVQRGLSCFSDFHGEQQWYWQTACAAKERGLVSGYPDGSFQGGRLVNLAEAVKMGTLAFDFTLPTYIQAPEHWYDPYFDAAASTTLFSRIDRDGAHIVTRADMAIIIALFGRFTGQQQCFSSDQCGASQICSTERGDCQSACPPGSDVCTQVCAGVCVNADPDLPTEPQCAEYVTNNETTVQCALCGDGVCDAYEKCVPSHCDGSICTRDCGGLNCPMDCR